MNAIGLIVAILVALKIAGVTSVYWSTIGLIFISPALLGIGIFIIGVLLFTVQYLFNLMCRNR